MLPDSNNLIKMEVGIEDCLYQQIEISIKGRDSRKDLFLARAHQNQAHGTLNHPPRDNRFAAKSINESEMITKFEIMDGAPVRGIPFSSFPYIVRVLISGTSHQGETIPIRLFLCGFDLTPTFRANKKFGTRYYLNLVHIDEENQRYFN
ncbi:hypothetical protein EDB89DRAFT_898676 [Lactarius sanguifluus]|nr:hypothetical protein EDB89DRAFT_898676 [Lactarius sanguifluus]